MQQLSYSYDYDDNVLNLYNNSNYSDSQSFGYDMLNQLTSATGAYGSLNWYYDLAGNRLSQTSSVNYGPQTLTSYDIPTAAMCCSDIRR